MSEPAVRTVELTKRFGRRTAVSALDLEVPRGRIFGFLGPNGAGKTTTIKLLTGLYRPTTGSASVLGFDTVRQRDRVQGHIGYLPGDFAGYADHTGARFLGLIGALRGGVDRDYVDQLAERLHVDLDRRLGTLSHGNRQKIGIIQAFMNRPALIILDEPTNGLDPLVQREFLSMLREERDAGNTVLLSSHVLSEVAAVADAVAIIDNGTLLTVRSMSELHADSSRRVDLRFDDQVPVVVLRNAPGVQSVHVSGLVAEVSVRGSLAELFKSAAPYGVVDVRTHESDLADVFLGYYKPEGGDDAQRLSQGSLGPTQEPSRLG